jgi:hypothetical protein
MKISPKKKGQIYDLVHQAVSDVRIDLRLNYLTEGNPLRNKVDFIIAQVEVPLTRKIIKLLQGESKE